MSVKISVLIPTKDRPVDLLRCVRSILRNDHENFEILILDQSLDNRTKAEVGRLNDTKVRYIFCKRNGKSNALNNGIKKAKGHLLAFTDDDCIVSRGWLSKIQSAFDDGVDISMVFGMSLPYKKLLHPNEICPSVFSPKTKYTVFRPCFHAQYIGFGNNMAIRKVDCEHGLNFKGWLGPGSIGLAAEDADISLRCLLHGNKIGYNDEILVYHNKWLTHRENSLQSLSYSCGEMACYGYFYFKGFGFARHVIFNNIKDSYHKLKMIFAKAVRLQLKRKDIYKMSFNVKQLAYRLWGLTVGLIHALTVPVEIDK